MSEMPRIMRAYLHCLQSNLDVDQRESLDYLMHRLDIAKKHLEFIGLTSLELDTAHRAKLGASQIDEI